MAAPDGVYCYCSDEATMVFDILVDGNVIGFIYTCADHTMVEGDEIEITTE